MGMVKMPYSDEASARLLHVVGERGQSSVLEQLLWDRANPNAVETDTQRTPVYIASARGHLDVVTFLCGAGVDKERATNDGATPLCVASAEGHLDVVTFLCGAGVDKER